MTATRHTHDPAAVERIAEAIWQKLLQHETGVYTIDARPLMDADNFEGCEFYLSPGPDVREMAVAALDAVETLYETEAGE